MTDVKFVVDYRGQYTGEVFYPAGTVATFTDGVAAGLIADGRAVAVVGPQDGQGEAMAPEPLPTLPTDWTTVKGVSTEIQAALHHLGLNTPGDLLNFVTMGGDLTAIPGIGKKRAADIVEWAEDNL